MYAVPIVIVSVAPAAIVLAAIDVVVTPFKTYPTIKESSGMLELFFT